MTADAPHADDAETAEVGVHVSGIRRVRGRGNIRFEATARVDIGGVVVEVYGLTLRAEPNNRLGCYLPSYRCGDGTWRPAIGLPALVERALALFGDSWRESGAMRRDDVGDTNSMPRMGVSLTGACCGTAATAFRTPQHIKILMPTPRNPTDMLEQ